MLLRLTRDQAEYLLGALEIWLEGYQDGAFDEDVPSDVVSQMLDDTNYATEVIHKLERKLGYVRRTAKF